MGKRITLSDRECKYIVEALKYQFGKGLDYLNERAGNRVLQDIIDKLSDPLKTERVRSDETLPGEHKTAKPQASSEPTRKEGME